MKTKKPRSRVFFTVENREGMVLERLEVSFDDYYGGGLAVVDSSEYRAERGIRRLKGETYGYKRNLMQSFEVEYGVAGKHLHSRAVHEDGTIVEDSRG